MSDWSDYYLEQAGQYRARARHDAAEMAGMLTQIVIVCDHLLAEGALDASSTAVWSALSEQAVCYDAYAAQAERAQQADDFSLLGLPPETRRAVGRRDPVTRLLVRGQSVLAQAATHPLSENIRPLFTQATALCSSVRGHAASAEANYLIGRYGEPIPGVVRYLIDFDPIHSYGSFDPPVADPDADFIHLLHAESTFDLDPDGIIRPNATRDQRAPDNQPYREPEARVDAARALVGAFRFLHGFAEGTSAAAPHLNDRLITLSGLLQRAPGHTESLREAIRQTAASLGREAGDEVTRFIANAAFLADALYTGQAQNLLRPHQGIELGRLPRRSYNDTTGPNR